MSDFNPDDQMDIFVKNVPVDVMIELGTKKLSSDGEKTSSDISSSIDVTYSHVIKVVKELEKKGLVITEKKGRKKIIELTDKGKEVSDNLRELKDILEQ